MGSRGGPVNRSEAATTLFRWQFEGERELVRAAGGDDRPLVSIVESLTGQRPRRALRRALPPPPDDFLLLEEEKAVERLRARVSALGSTLRPEEYTVLEERFRNSMPANAIAALHDEVDRLGAQVPPPPPEEAKGHVPPTPSAPSTLRAVLLFSRDGRLLASEGAVESLDLAMLSALVSRGEPRTTWRLGHRAGVLLGHVGERAGLVALFSGDPKVAVRATLRASITSLEQKDRLANALTHPSSHQTLLAYVRAVRVLLAQHA